MSTAKTALQDAKDALLTTSATFESLAFPAASCNVYDPDPAAVATCPAAIGRRRMLASAEDHPRRNLAANTVKDLDMISALVENDKPVEIMICESGSQIAGMQVKYG